MSSSPVARPLRPRDLLVAVAVLAVLILVAYCNTLAVPFVFDDGPAIERNPSLHSLATAWSPPANGSPVTGRPLLNVSFALNYALGGFDARGYHATNLVIHLAAALALFGLVRRTLEAPLAPAFTRLHIVPLALIVALLWALHPLQTASVTYISQRAESLAGLFSLLSLYAYARGAVSPFRLRWHAFAGIAALAGVAAKETALVVPVLALLWDRTFFSGSLRAAWQRHRTTHLALFATWVPLVLLVLGTHGRGGTAGSQTGIQVVDYLLTQAGAILHYLRLALWPHPLVFDYGTPIAPWSITSGLSVVTVVVLLGGTAWALVRQPLWGFAGCWFFLTLAPSSSVVPVATQTIAEHRMYLPLAAILGVVVIASARWITRPVGWITATALALTLGVSTFLRNGDYATAEKLWRDTVVRRPDNARAHHNLGQAILASGRPTEAAASFAAALALEPNHVKALDGLGSARLAAGDVPGAVAAATRAVQLDPTYVAGRVNLGAALARAGRTEDAIRQFREALRLEPTAADANLNLGLLMLHLDRPSEALAPLQQASTAMPASEPARNALAEAHHRHGLVLARSGRFTDARSHLEESVRLHPNSPEARANLGNVCLQVGDAVAAVTQYETALQLNPRLMGVGDNLKIARELLAQRPR